MDLLGDAVGGRGISECLADACAGLTCSNGGSCQIIQHSQPICLCPLGFAGPACNSGKLKLLNYPLSLTPDYSCGCGSAILHWRVVSRPRLTN